MKVKSKFSVIVPMYNSEKYIENIIKDFVKNNLNDIELILVDDGSTDKTEQVCSKYISNNIRYFFKKNGGPSSARNYGLMKSVGEYIAFVDSDDRIDFNNMYKNFEYIKREKLDLLIIPFVGEKHKYVYYENINVRKDINKLIITEQINSPCNKIYRKKIIVDNNIKFDTNYNLGEDLLFNIDYYKFCKFVRYSNDRYYYYIKRNNSLTTIYRENKIYTLLKVNDDLYNKCIEFDKNLCDAVLCIKIKNFYSCLKDISSCKDDIKIKIEKVNKLKVLFDIIKVKSLKFEVLRKVFVIFPSIMLINLFKVLKRH